MVVDARRAHRRQPRWTGERLWRWLWQLLFVAVVLGPALALVVGLGQSLVAGNGRWLELALPVGLRLELLVRSVGLAVSVAAAGMLLGTLAASLLWRWHSGPGRYGRWFVLVLVSVPAYVHALAWSALVVALNATLHPLGVPEIPLRGWLVAWWVQLMALLPLAVGLALIGLEAVDPRLIEAARLLRSDSYGLVRIVIPLAAPAILAGGGFLFLLSLTDYSVPSLFQVNVYSLEIFAEFSASNEPARAFLLAVPLLAITSVVVVLTQSWLRRTAQTPARHSRPWLMPAWPRGVVWLQRTACIVLAAQVIVPLVVLVLTTGSWPNLIHAVASAQSETAFTLTVAGLAALISLPLALAAADRLARPGRGGHWWWLVMVPLAIPAPLVGIGLIALWNRPLGIGVYGSGLMPVLAVLARFAPLAVVVLLVQLRQMDPATLEAARVFRTSRLKAWARVHLPMLLPGLLAAGSIVLVLSAGELGATLLVAPPGQATLTMRIYNFLHYGASETVAGLCLMITVLTLAGGVLAGVALTIAARLTERQA